MSLSHSVQIANKQNDALNPIIQFLNTLNDVPQKYGSFEKAEQAIRELVVELEKSMVQETLSQYDINQYPHCGKGWQSLSSGFTPE